MNTGEPFCRAQHAVERTEFHAPTQVTHQARVSRFVACLSACVRARRPRRARRATMCACVRNAALANSILKHDVTDFFFFITRWKDVLTFAGSEAKGGSRRNTSQQSTALTVGSAKLASNGMRVERLFSVLRGAVSIPSRQNPGRQKHAKTLHDIIYE